MAEEMARLQEELHQVQETILAQQQLLGALPAPQRETILGALQARQKTLETQIAALAGSGAIAQGAGAMAVGAGSVLVAGNVYMGPPPANPQEALSIYRQVLAVECSRLPLRGVDLGASDPSCTQPFRLASVYVALDTRTQVEVERKKTRRREPLPIERETRPLPALEAVAANPRTVLVGDPGGGKSTFVNHLAYCLAAGKTERLVGWPAEEATAVPIPLLLRDFARWLPERVDRAEPRLLWDFLCARLEARRLAFAGDALGQALEGGQAVVLLDGLDEVIGRERRLLVRDAVASFAGRYRKSRFVVTCRTLSYQDPAGRLPDFASFELAPFDADKIDRFIGAWYEELVQLGQVRPEDAGGLAQKLRDAVRRPDLWRLAPNPLLLTVMALVHTHKNRLPEARALLYEDVVDILLWRWEEVKAGGAAEAPPLRQLLQQAGRGDVDLKRVLWRVAYEAHAQGGSGTELADIGQAALERALAGLHPEGSLRWAGQVVETMKLRAGLLLERAPEVFTFPHRTFQEYLAGAHLAAQVDFARQAVHLAGEGAQWREVILLAVGRLVYLGGEIGRPLLLAGELCPAKAVDEEEAWRRAWLAGDVLVEAGVARVRESALGEELWERVRWRLAGLLRGGHLPPVERAAAGRALAALGDPRFRADTWYLPAEPLLGFVEVEGGPFLMGSSAADEQAFGGEQPQHQVTLPTFYIARYPVTNAQFQAFVEAGGYSERRYWKEAAKAGRWGHGQVRPSWIDIHEGETEGKEEWATAPADFGDPYHLPNHPVVGITWYEALAYCRWLGERLGEIASQRIEEHGEGGEGP
jgi:hypothetical protein